MSNQSRDDEKIVTIDEEDDEIANLSLSDSENSAWFHPAPPAEKRFFTLPFKNETDWKRISAVLSKEITIPAELFRSLQLLHNTTEEMDFGALKWLLNNPNQMPFMNDFFTLTLPFIQTLALEMPQLFDEPKLPLLFAGVQDSVTLSQRQIACLLAHGFFGTLRQLPFKYQDNHYEWPQFRFEELQSWCFFPLCCLLNYFCRCQQRYGDSQTNNNNGDGKTRSRKKKRRYEDGAVTYHRRVLENANLIDLSTCQLPLRPLVVDDTEKIKIEEDHEAKYHADFANEYLGGGALHGGNVQEEILFAIKPECFVGMLICAKMEPNEAILIRGAEQFSKYRGYGGRVQWDGDFVDNTERDALRRKDHVIVAIDAALSPVQYLATSMRRDVLKAYIGFTHESLWKVHCAIRKEGDQSRVNASVGLVETTHDQGDNDNDNDQEETKLDMKQLNAHTVATGNWGCGAFGGDHSLKVLQQILAASLAGVNTMHYYSFGDRYRGRSLVRWIDQVNLIIQYYQPDDDDDDDGHDQTGNGPGKKSLTVADLWNVLVESCASDKPTLRATNCFKPFIKRFTPKK